MTDGDAERIVAALADRDRLRVVAALLLDSCTISEIETTSSLDLRSIEKALSRLIAAGLVTKDRRGYRFATEEVLAAARSAAERRSTEEGLGHPPAASSVLRTFIRDGRLITIPAVRAKRLVVLDHLAQEFDPGLRYLERDVNHILAQYHSDVASLRRHLVDEGFMEREAGEYWRAGGTYTIE
ncbi:MAG: DUF2087 domain-containing protein [Actinomycetota bacterium]|nr:DUF2087 domain-containing protein [Actinomycetota bacterium]